VPYSLPVLHVIEWYVEADIYCHHSLIKLSPSWQAANCAATQEFPSISWNTKIHYRVHKSPPLAPIPSQINPIYTIPSL
jgi:hypothetical protein